jgi:hypothetical protein
VLQGVRERGRARNVNRTAGEVDTCQCSVDLERIRKRRRSFIAKGIARHGEHRQACVHFERLGERSGTRGADKVSRENQALD